MVEMNVDIFSSDAGVNTRIKGPAFAIRPEIIAMVHTLLMNYAHVSKISYDAAKLEVMCRIANAEQTIGQEALDREFKEGTVEYGEDE